MTASQTIVRAAVAVAAAGAATVGFGVVTGHPAHAAQQFGTSGAAGGVYWRSAPDWATRVPAPGFGVYPGSRIAVSCYQWGTTVPGSANHMWVQASIVGGPGRGSGWVSEHFVDGSAPIDRAAPGVPPCGGPTPAPARTAAPARPPAPAPAPAPSSARGAAAAGWASRWLGRNAYSGLCLTFVSDAWQASGVSLRNEIGVLVGSDTYPADVWGHFTGGRTGTSATNIPAGAIVFYASKTGRRDLSHVTISLGNGVEVSSADWLNERAIHTETVAQHSYSIYQGWWLP